MKNTRRSSLAILATLIAVTFASCHKPSTTSHATPTSSEVTVTNQTDADKELAQRLREICDRAEGQIGFAVTHVETGRSIGVNAKTNLPLYSVFKLPLAIAVLKDVEANRLKIDQAVHVTPEE